MKSKSVAIILYYKWASDGRAKTSGNIYKKLGYELLVYSVNDEDFPKFRKDNNERVWCGTEKYRGSNMLTYLTYHLIFIIQSSFWLLKRCLIDKPKILHIHNMPDYLMVVSLIGKLFGMKVVWDLGDITPVTYLTKKKLDTTSTDNKLYKLMVLIQNLSAKPASTILCADSFQKDYLIKYGLPEDKVKVFMNLPLEDSYKWIGPAKSKVPFVLVYHGTITHRLGLDLAIRAIAKINNGISIKFRIIGEGDQADDLFRLIKELKLEDKVELTNKEIPNEKIPEWVRGASGGIIPNRKTFATDNFMLPHKMLEYVKLGIPVIAPKLKIIQHYFKDDQAIFFEPENIDDLSSAIKKLHSIDGEKQAQNALSFFNVHGYQNNYNIIEKIVTQ